MSKAGEDEIKSKLASAIGRRQALKFVGGALSIPVLQHLTGEQLFALGREMHEGLGAGGPGLHVFETLDAHQNATVKVLVDLIIPQTDTPGALAVRVNEFIDLVLTDVLEAEDKDRFLTGLLRLDRESQAAYGRDFVDCESDQQVELLTALEKDAQAMEAKPRLPSGRYRLPPREHFFHLAKWLTLYGYYTSEAGLTGELGFVMIPGSYSGCLPRP